CKRSNSMSVSCLFTLCLNLLLLRSVSCRSSCIKHMVASFSSKVASGSFHRFKIRTRGYVDIGRSEDRLLKLISHDAKIFAVVLVPPRSSAKKQITVQNGDIIFV